jgi:hypothetical protein
MDSGFDDGGRGQNEMRGGFSAEGPRRGVLRLPVKNRTMDERGALGKADQASAKGDGADPVTGGFDGGASESGSLQAGQPAKQQIRQSMHAYI